MVPKLEGNCEDYWRADGVGGLIARRITVAGLLSAFGPFVDANAGPDHRQQRRDLRHPAKDRPDGASDSSAVAYMLEFVHLTFPF